MKLYAVHWLDAHTEGGWVHDTSKLTPSPCVSVGFVISENDDYVVLGQSHGIDCAKRDDPEYCNAICIPRTMVTRIQELPSLE